MKAAVRTKYGPPDVVRIEDVEKPAIKDGEVLIQVRATTVNRTDCGYRGGKPALIRLFAGVPKPRATVLGTEFAGVVTAVAIGVTALRVGDRVFGYCEGRFGAHAEYMSMPAHGAIATIPANMSFEEAAPSTEGSHYALGIIRAAKIGSGQHVLVYGATGAIGSAAVQLLRNVGANVTAVCGTEHLELVRGLGANRVVDYTAEDFTKDPQTYDVIFDAVGKSAFGRCKHMLTPRGIYVSTELGPKGQNPFLALATPLFRRRRVLFPLPRNDNGMAQHFKGLIESGAFRPVIDRRYPLDEIADAYRYVETGQKVGNVVVTIEPS
jgi:NADPH:quinone reductase-like Zn-dependent oxidoreductase